MRETRCRHTVVTASPVHAALQQTAKSQVHSIEHLHGIGHIFWSTFESLGDLLVPNHGFCCFRKLRLDDVLEAVFSPSAQVHGLRVTYLADLGNQLLACFQGRLTAGSGADKMSAATRSSLISGLFVGLVGADPSLGTSTSINELICSSDILISSQHF